MVNLKANQPKIIRILQVDDDRSLLEISKLILLDIDCNFVIDHACSVDQGLNKLAAESYDVVVSDYEMPQKDGLQFLKELREQKYTIPFILFTGKGREEVAIKALNLGADGYFDKHGSPQTVYGELHHGIHSVVNRRKAEEALRMSEEDYDKLINGMNDIAWVTDFNCNFVEINDAAVKFLGYSKAELLSMGPSDIDKSLSKQQIIDNIKQMRVDAVQVFETTLATKDEKIIPVEIISSLVTYKGKKAILSIARNITERKKAEEALVKAEAHYHGLFDNLDEGFELIEVIRDEKGEACDFRYLEVNRVYEEQSGMKSSEIVGKTTSEIFPDSEEYWLEVFDKVERTGKPDSFENYSKPLHGYYQTYAFPFGKNQVGVLIRDITKRKKSEQEQKDNNQKIRLINEKLSIVGSLTRHDVGNKLAIIQFNEFLLRKSIGNNPELAKYLDGIKTAVDNSNNLLEFSRLYERIGVEKLTKMNVFECVNMAAALFSSLSSVKIMNDCQGLEVMADSMLKQLFYNLIDNSLKHGKKVDQIRIHFSKKTDKVRLFYEDNGGGIAEVNKSKIFGVGFTTGGGSGLGLYLVKKMIESYGWTITEEGEPGKGVKFSINIPKRDKNGKKTI